jgi:hypothetical protein
VIDDLEIDNILELIDPNNIRVYQPTSILFICGGPIDVTTAHPSSLREAFMRIAVTKKFERHQALLAEDINAFFPRGDYRDLLTLESDIAQISSLVVVFSESYGSAAELGAFSMIPEIAKKLLIVIDAEKFEENSFIKLGPLRALQNSTGDNAVSVMVPKDFGIEKIENLNNLNMDEFSTFMDQSILNRLSSIPAHSTFKKENSGHLCKIVVGVLQWFGALTEEEIEVALYCLEVQVESGRLRNLLLCIEIVGWVASVRRGVRTFYAAKVETSATRFVPKAGTELPNKVRWQAAIREHWSKVDPMRFKSIAETVAEN